MSLSIPTLAWAGLSAGGRGGRRRRFQRGLSGARDAGNLAAAPLEEHREDHADAHQPVTGRGLNNRSDRECAQSEQRPEDRDRAVRPMRFDSDWKVNLGSADPLGCAYSSPRVSSTARMSLRRMRTAACRSESLSASSQRRGRVVAPRQEVLRSIWWLLRK